MSDITHFCDLNSPIELKEAVVDHPKLRQLCADTSIKRLRQYLAYLNPERKVEIAIISSEVEEKIADQAARRSRVALVISIVAAIASFASAGASWGSYLSSKSARSGKNLALKKEPNQASEPTAPSGRGSP